MTLEQLRIFVVVAQREHMTQAAADLAIAQSAVSTTIAALEARHRTRLFERVGRGIRLTTAGRLFLPKAQAIIDQADEAASMLADLAAVRLGRLQLQASETIASYWLPRRLVAFRESFPGVRIAVNIGNSSEAAHAVVDGCAELGFIEGPVQDERLAVIEIARDQMLVVVGPNHAWASRAVLGAAELADGEWVMREPGSGTRTVLEADLSAAGVQSSALRVVMELPRNEAVVSAVQAGLGASGISANAAVASLEAGLLVKAPFDLPVRTFAVVHLADRQLSAAADALLALLLGKHRCHRQPEKPPFSR